MLRPFVHQQSQMLKDLEDLLESSLHKLKTDVAFIVKKKKEYLLPANSENEPAQNCKQALT